MMSYDTIREMSRRAAAESRRNGTRPRVVEEEDLLLSDERLLAHLRPIPFVGDRATFRGLRKASGDLFVDSSGWGAPDEAALTQDQFLAKVRENGPNHAYAVTEAGQFQVWVGVWTVIGHQKKGA